MNSFFFQSKCTQIALLCLTWVSFRAEGFRERASDEWKADEALDCQIIDLIREQVLEHYNQVPKDFLLQVVVLLNMGSMHSATESGIFKKDTIACVA